MLIEQCEIPPTIGQHFRIRRQNLAVYHIVLFKPHRSIDQSAHLKMRVREIMKALVSGEIESQPLRNELIGLWNPSDQVRVRLIGDQQIVCDVNWSDPYFISDHCLDHLQECHANFSSK